jgi:Zn-finger nucleic acid-binding protein/ribosomal protein L40E
MSRAGGPAGVQLIACSNCHTQYDVSGVVEKTFPCRCGETLENRPRVAVDALIHRCGSCGAGVGAEAESCTFCGSEIVRDERELSLICPECYARSTDDSRFCTACGVAFRPEPVKLDGHELPCPSCGALMPPHRVGDVSVNECRGCAGLWVPGENFDLLVSRAAEARRDTAPEKLALVNPRVKGSNPAAQHVKYRKCPECESFMQRRNFRRSSGVILDTCGAHGTWLDADELEKIAGFILSGGRPAQTLVREEAQAKRALAKADFARIRARRGFGSGGATRSSGSLSSLVDLLSSLLD